MKKLQRWLNKVKENKANCYIKPTRYVHESGYRCFEVGYCEMGVNAKVKNKIVLGNGSDHIWDGANENKFHLNMDLTKDGYIRIWTHEGTLVWEKGHDHVFSSADLTFIPKHLKKEVR